MVAIESHILLQTKRSPYFVMSFFTFTLFVWFCFVIVFFEMKMLLSSAPFLAKKNPLKHFYLFGFLTKFTDIHHTLLYSMYAPCIISRQFCDKIFVILMHCYLLLMCYLCDRQWKLKKKLQIGCGLWLSKNPITKKGALS